MVEGNSDEPRPRAAFDTNPLTPKETRASFKVIRPQDHGAFVSKRECSRSQGLGCKRYNKFVAVAFNTK